MGGMDPRRKSSGRGRKSSAFDKTARRASMVGQLVIKEGYLNKQASGLIKKWQTRYFVLAGHYLKYYEKKEETKSDETIKGVVDVRTIRQVTREGSCFSLEMADKSKSVTLRATSDQLAELWVTEFEQLRKSFAPRKEAAEAEAHRAR